MPDFCSLPKPNLGEGALNLLSGVVKGEDAECMRDCCKREATFVLPLVGRRDAAGDMADDRFVFKAGLCTIDAGEGSSSSTMTQWRRKSSFSQLPLVRLLLTAGRSGVVSGGGSRCCSRS